MLCPVCKLNPLTGRKATAKTCSTKCRSTLYRERKQQQRDASRHAGSQAAGTMSATSGSASRRQRSSPSASPAKWAQLISSATDRIIEAIQKHGLPPAPRATDALRVDMRGQIISQAPKKAVGYRLVLPAHHGGHVPKLSPKRCRARQVAWYSLAPFEYPDDIRLCDGFWYRIIWIDEAGQRIRLQPGESIPGLYYFVGPPQLGGQASLGSPTATGGLQSEDRPDISIKPADPHQPPVAAERATPPPVAEAAAVPTPTQTTVPSASPVPGDGNDIDTLVREFARASKLDQESTEQPDGLDESTLPPGSLIIMAPPPPATAPPESWTQLLASFPPLTADESLMLAAFVVHPELMVQIRYEEQLAEAKATGRPLPREPVTLIRQEARQNLRELFKNQLLPPYFWSRCRAIFEYVRQHGIDVLAHLPVPISGVSATEIRWIENAMTNPHKRAYMHYVCSRQDALLSGQALPTEPSVPISSKERNQVRKVLEDLRAVMYFKERVAAFEA